MSQSEFLCARGVCERASWRMADTDGYLVGIGWGGKCFQCAPRYAARFVGALVPWCLGGVSHIR